MLWALWHLPLLISDPTGQRPVGQFADHVAASQVVLSWLYNSTRASLPLVIISRAAVDTVARFVLPQFTGTDYQLIWWCQAALWTRLALLVAATTRSTLNAASPHPSHGRQRAASTAEPQTFL